LPSAAGAVWALAEPRKQDERMLNGIRARVRAARHLRLGFALLAPVVGGLFVAGTAPAAQSQAPAGCHVTPCLLIAPAGGDTYVFTAWESGASAKIHSIDLTLWSKGPPTDVRSTGHCGAPVGPGRYSLTVFYYNLTCKLHPAGREIQVCFNDRDGLEKHYSTAEYLQGGVDEAYAVQKVAAVPGCPVK
jgi:hypothetical protein